jgi:serine-type D-Ala-D-Ala carboxypeptidase/endopeptidase
MQNTTTRPVRSGALRPILALVASAGIGLVAQAGAVTAQHVPPADELAAMVRFIALDGGPPGLVFGVVEPDGGTRVVAWGAGVSEDAIFEIASIGKAFTATVLADMALRGEVSLEDPVAMRLPAHVTVPTIGGRPMTLLDLATHRTGLPPMPDNVGRRNPYGVYPAYGVDDLYAFLASQAERGILAADYLYSNVNYGLLGHALALAAGTSYRDLIRQRILDPLGMRDTDVAAPGGGSAADDGRLVRPHRRGEPAPYLVATEALQGAGAMRSTARDMLRFAAANVGPPRTDLERAMRLAQQLRVPVGDDGGGHALAWRLIARPGEPMLVMHGGLSAGMSARLAFLPDEGVGSILLANEYTFGFQHGGGAHLLFPLPPDRRWVEADVAPDLLARYQGRYAVTAAPEGRRARGTYDVRLDDDILTLRPRGGDAVRLWATSDTTFYVLGTPLEVAFRQDPVDGERVMEARERVGEGERAGGRDRAVARRRPGGRPPRPRRPLDGPRPRRARHSPGRGPGEATVAYIRAAGPSSPSERATALDRRGLPRRRAPSAQPWSAASTIGHLVTHAVFICQSPRVPARRLGTWRRIRSSTVQLFPAGSTIGQLAPPPGRRPRVPASGSRKSCPPRPRGWCARGR